MIGTVGVITDDSAVLCLVSLYDLRKVDLNIVKSCPCARAGDSRNLYGVFALFKLDNYVNGNVRCRTGIAEGNGDFPLMERL